MDTTEKTFAITIKRKDAVVDIAGTIPKDLISQERTEVLKRIAEGKKAKGFRDGHVPPALVKEGLDDLSLWQECAREVCMRHFPEMLADARVFPIQPPALSFTSIAIENDVSFTMHCHTTPTTTVANYHEALKAIDASPNAEGATEKEIHDVLTDIRRGIYRRAHPEKEIPDDEKTLPPITDAIVQEISQKSTIYEEFEKEIRASITNEKKIAAQVAHRKKIFDALLPTVTMSVPTELVQKEADHAFSEMQANAKQMQTTIDAYLKQRKITEEDLKKEISHEAEKRIKIQILLNAIAAQEDIQLDKARVEKEVVRLANHHKKETPKTHLRAWVKNALTSEAVVRYLEELVSKPK